MTVALVGKYTDLPDAYLSVTEALRAGGFANWAKVEIAWVPSDDCETAAGAAAALRAADGGVLPPVAAAQSPSASATSSVTSRTTIRSS